MKIKTLVAVLLLSGGVTSTFAQSDCNANSSISHEAVRAKNYKDAYAPCMAEFKEEVQAAFPNNEIVMNPLSLSVSCHIGPGALAIACSKKIEYCNK